MAQFSLLFIWITIDQINSKDKNLSAARTYDYG